MTELDFLHQWELSSHCFPGFTSSLLLQTKTTKDNSCLGVCIRQLWCRKSETNVMSGVFLFTVYTELWSTLQFRWLLWKTCLFQVVWFWVFFFFQTYHVSTQESCFSLSSTSTCQVPRGPSWLIPHTLSLPADVEETQYKRRQEPQAPSGKEILGSWMYNRREGRLNGRLSFVYYHHFNDFNQVRRWPKYKFGAFRSRVLHINPRSTCVVITNYCSCTWLFCPKPPNPPCYQLTAINFKPDTWTCLTLALDVLSSCPGGVRSTEDSFQGRLQREGTFFLWLFPYLTCSYLLDKWLYLIIPRSKPTSKVLIYRQGAVVLTHGASVHPTKRNWFIWAPYPPPHPPRAA